MRLADTLLSESTADLFLRTSLVALLCIAASPSPLVLPLAVVVAYQPEWMRVGWAAVSGYLGSEGVLLVLVPGSGFFTYISHGLFCLYFDSIYRPEALLQFKIQVKKGGLETERIPKVIYHKRIVHCR